MSLRTIMLFPQFENMEIIDHIRNKYDPLAKSVRPHITLVFPFESRMSNEELKQILDVRLLSVKPFELKLGGIGKQEDAFGNSLYLDVLKGAEEICSIHQTLYDHEFKEFDLGLRYIPHMTIGKLPTAQLLEDAFHDMKFMDHTFHTIIHKVSVERIGDHKESIIVLEKELV